MVIFKHKPTIETQGSLLSLEAPYETCPIELNQGSKRHICPIEPQGLIRQTFLIEPQGSIGHMCPLILSSLFNHLS